MLGQLREDAVQSKQALAQAYEAWHADIDGADEAPHADIGAWWPVSKAQHGTAGPLVANQGGVSRRMILVDANHRGVQRHTHGRRAIYV